MDLVMRKQRGKRTPVVVPASYIVHYWNLVTGFVDYFNQSAYVTATERHTHFYRNNRQNPSQGCNNARCMEHGPPPASVSLVECICTGNLIYISGNCARACDDMSLHRIRMLIRIDAGCAMRGVL
eukprot:7568910-Pyramimonas_sp.AAC.1